MKEFVIYVQNTFGKYAVCTWIAGSAKEAVSQFLEENPDYKRVGNIVAVEDK